MTKVECPGPGFKGLKWKWIQNHAKEQQEREKGRQSDQPTGNEAVDTRPPGLPSAGECSGSHSDARASVPPGQSNGIPCTSAGLAGSVLPGNTAHPVLPIKVETGHGPPGPGPGLPPVLAIPAQPADVDVRRQPQVGKPSGEPHAAPPMSGSQPANGKVSVVGASSATAQAAPASGTAPEPTASIRPPVHAAIPAPAGAGLSAIGLPSSSQAASLSGRRQLELSTASLVPKIYAPASPPAALQSPPPPAAPAAPSQPVAPAAVATFAAGPPATAGPAPASAPATQQGCTGTVGSGAGPPTVVGSVAVQPSSAAAGPSAPAVPSTTNAAPSAAATARVRMPPSRGPSLTVATVNVKGGDDFESMFTPLSSLPVLKSETALGAGAVGSASRAGSILVGTQASGPGGCAGGSGSAIAGGSAADTSSLAADRKVTGKKGAKLQDGRASVGPEQADAEHGHGSRSRTPVGGTACPGAIAASGSGKDAPGVGSGVGSGNASKAQHQSPGSQQPGPGPHGQAALQQRPSGAKHAGARDAKDGSKAREVNEVAGSGSAAGAAQAGAGSQAAGAGAAAAVAAASVGRTGGGDKEAVRSAGAAAVAEAPPGAGHGAGDKGERKRPRSDGSKPKAGQTTTVIDADFGAPYVETLADRIKRARRTTTSSSEHEGPPSHGSGDRPPCHGATAGGGASANAAGAPAAGGQEGRPRPATSAEAQSRGADATHGVGNASNRGPQPAGDSPAAGSGAGATLLPGAKQQHGHSSGRGDDASTHPGAGHRAPAPAQDKPPEQSHNASGLTLRTSVGGAVTDSSGGGAGHAPAQAPGVAAVGQGPGRPVVVGAKRFADFPSRGGSTTAKVPRSDPLLPRPSGPHVSEPRGGAGAADGAPTATGKAPAPPQGPPPSGKLAHRSSSGPQAGKVHRKQGVADGQAPPSGATAITGGGGGAARGQRPSPTAPPARLGRPVEGDMPAAGSCKGPAGGSRGSKDGAGDKGACGPRGGGGGGGGGAPAATTTTEPKTDSDTRTSRVVECYFEFEEPCRAAGGGSATVSGLGSSGSLQAGTLRLGGVRHGGGGGGGVLRGCATAPPQHLDLCKVRSFKELWAQLAALYNGTLPDEMDSKIIYLDEEGDWIMVTPDEPWSSMAAAATKVLVTNRT